jgi:aminodeoxyfutalosine synthase
MTATMLDFEQLGETLAGGATLSAGQLRDLVHSRDLIGLGMLAADARTRRHGMHGTFVRVEVVDVAAAPEDMPATIPAEAGEVRLQGRPASLAVAVAAVRRVADVARVPVTGFALEDLTALGASLAETLHALREAGLSAVATARIDRLDAASLEAVADAGLAVQAVTLGTPLDGEAFLDALERLRAWQAATGVIRACVPLPIETPPDHPTTGYDDMRHVAIARLVLDNVAHVQAHWPRMGAKLAQSCLLFGADDVDGVPARDAMLHGPRRAILEEVRRNVRAASLVPVERDGAYARREPDTEVPATEAERA